MPRKTLWSAFALGCLVVAMAVPAATAQDRFQGAAKKSSGPQTWFIVEIDDFRAQYDKLAPDKQEERYKFVDMQTTAEVLEVQGNGLVLLVGKNQKAGSRCLFRCELFKAADAKALKAGQRITICGTFHGRALDAKENTFHLSNCCLVRP